MLNLIRRYVQRVEWAGRTVTLGPLFPPLFISPDRGKCRGFKCKRMCNNSCGYSPHVFVCMLNGPRREGAEDKMVGDEVQHPGSC